MKYDKSVMAIPCRGKLLDMAFGRGRGDRLSVEFRVIHEDGRNFSALACAKLLPWVGYEENGGVPLLFEIGEMYSVEGCVGLKVRVRWTQSDNAPPDLVLEAAYIPFPGETVIEAKDAFAFMGKRLIELGIIDETDARRFETALKVA